MLAFGNLEPVVYKQCIDYLDKKEINVYVWSKRCGFGDCQLLLVNDIHSIGTFMRYVGSMFFPSLRVAPLEQTWTNNVWLSEGKRTKSILRVHVSLQHLYTRLILLKHSTAIHNHTWNHMHITSIHVQHHSTISNIYVHLIQGCFIEEAPGPACLGTATSMPGMHWAMRLE